MSQQTLSLVADVLVIGGGPAGAWAAIAARAAGCDVILADKGFLGTSGATAPSNTETWLAAPGAPRAQAIARHIAKTSGLCDADHTDRVLDGAYRGLARMVAWSYPFPGDADGRPYLGNLRGPDYMRFLRRRVIGAGVQVLDHHPALELMADGDGVTGAAGVDRQFHTAWRARASAVVLATGGCAFGARILGATGLTGDGYLMAMEAGATLSGMELSSQYAVTPAGSSLNKGMTYRWASFYDDAGRHLGEPGEDRQVFIADALANGRVFARLDKAGKRERDWLRRGQANCFLPFDRAGIDPFTDRFEVTLRCEGTVRGVGGIRLVSSHGETGVSGLYAAGDVASREDLTGAITGGGGPNASWAIASGTWAGEAAGSFARGARRSRDARNDKPLGDAGLHASSRTGAQSDRPSTSDVNAAVGAQILAVERNFYRTAAGLDGSLAVLDSLWSDYRGSRADARRSASDPETLRCREAAAMLAASRWALASAAARQESRGMHRRTDYRKMRPDGPRRLGVRGIDEIELVPRHDLAAGSAAR